jgi:hypothetical protein
MSEPKTYTGGCHCGAVRYEVHMALDSAVTCNCTICQKTGTALTFAPASQFKLVSGEAVLTDYLFGRKSIHHLFCKTCGIRSFARGTMPDGSPVAAINVRCLDDVDLEAVPTKQYNGRAL